MLIENIAATSWNIAPAWAPVSAPASAALTSSTAELFEWETLQLTQSVLTNLTNLALTNIKLFEYPTTTTGSTADCKVFPGDPYWPSPVAWEILNVLSGNALIKTVPLAAPCYSDWPEYNAATCASITSQWNDPHLQ